MPSMRIIKPEFWTDPTIAKLTSLETLLFIGMWTYAKDNGVGIANSKYLLGMLFCFRDEVEKHHIEDGLLKMQSLGLIELFTDRDFRYYRVCNWGTLQSTTVHLRLDATAWKALRVTIFARDKFTCQYCGAKDQKLECDHIVPVSRGGSNDILNLTTACKACNSSKGNKLVDEWLKRDVTPCNAPQNTEIAQGEM
jgi:hypothetical protein